MSKRKKYENLTPEEKSAKRAKAEAMAEKAFNQDIKRSKYFTYIMVFVVVAILVGSFLVPRSKSAKGSYFHVVVPLDSMSFDPQKSSNSWELGVCSLIYEGLVKFEEKLVLEDSLDALKYEPRFKEQISRYEVEPALATSWNYDETDKTWTFTLRQDIRFHDNNNFTAASVIASFTRLLGTDEVSVDESADFPARDFYSNINSIYRIGDYEVVFELKQRDPMFLQKLALPQASIISSQLLSKEKTAEYDLKRETSGTGPYELKSIMGNDYVFLIRNDAYWGLKGYPGLNIVLLDDEQAAYGAIEVDEEIDMMVSGSISTVTRASENESLSVVEAYSRFFASVVINTNTGDNTSRLLANDVLRKTVMKSINSNEILNDNLFEFFNIDQLPRDQQDKRTPEEILKTNESLQTQKYADSEKIELELTIPIMSTGYLPKITSIARSIKDQLEDVNIDLKVTILPQSEFFKRWMEGNISFTIANFNDDWFYSVENFYNCAFNKEGNKEISGFEKIENLQEIINEKDKLSEQFYLKEIGHLLRTHVLVSSIKGEAFKIVPSFFDLLKSSE